MPVVRELVTRLTFDTDMAKIRQFDKRIGEVRQNVKSLSGNLGEVSRNVRNFGAGMSLFLTAPIALLGKSMVTAASEAEESDQKFRVVFKSIGEEAEKTSQDLAKSFGLAGATARSLLGDTGDLLSGFGFSTEKALELSKQVNFLAGDLQSFQDIEGGTAEAGMKLTKGLLGQTENLLSLGIAVDQGSKEFKKRTKELMLSEKVTERQARVLNLLELSFTQSKNAIGDYARTSTSAANQFRKFSERIKNLKETFGVLLLPMLAKITGVLIKFVDFISGLPKPIKIMILAFAGLAAIIGPLILIIGLLGQAIAGIIALGPILGGVGIVGMGAFLILAAKIIAVIAAISAAIYLLVDDFMVWKNGGDSVIGSLLGNFENFKTKVVSIFNFVKDFIMSFWAAVTEGGAENWDKFLNLLIKGFIGYIKLLGQFWMKVPEIAFKVAKTVLKIFFGMFLKLGEIVSGFAGAVIKKVAGLLGIQGGGTANESSQQGNVFSTPSLAGFTPPAVTGSSKNIDVKASVTLQVPEGTSAEQQTSLVQSAEKLFDERLNDAMGNAILANRRNEQ